MGHITDETSLRKQLMLYGHEGIILSKQWKKCKQEINKTTTTKDLREYSELNK